MLPLAFTAIVYWPVLQLATNTYFTRLAVEGDVVSNIEKLEDWLETLDQLLLLLAFTASVY